MKSQEPMYQSMVAILRQELIAAMGCTEPIALALCAAKARAVLGELPEKVELEVSGNIIKNVKSVTVPNTDGAKGIEAAVAIGIVAGHDEWDLEVIREVSSEQKRIFRQFLKTTPILVHQANSDLLLDIQITALHQNDVVKVRLANQHTNFVLIEKNGFKILEKEIGTQEKSSLDYDCLTMEHIYDFAQSVKIQDVQEVLQRQIDYNSAISQEGLRHNYGANIGKVLLEVDGEEIKNRAKAWAAAGSDARMNGCELPVVINSGSGNQGMTASLPVIAYAEHLHRSQEMLYRALVISNLTAIHLKQGIGCLSAYCGAVSAAASAGAAIAYLHGYGYLEIAHTVVNSLAITSGIVCDGAKASCAAKIAISIDAAILGFEMISRGQQFHQGEGVVSDDIEKTIRNIGRLGREGMRETDREILEIMTCVD